MIRMILSEVECRINMCNINPIFAYFTPETLLPMSSIVAAVLGVAMMIGRGSVRVVIRYFRRRIRPSSGIAGVSHPHYRLQEQGEPQTPRALTGVGRRST
jgi:hypothetical protein